MTVARGERAVALAADYDGTLAHHGNVDVRTVEALRRLKRSGRRLVLATGRELEELTGVFPELELFDRVVAENGALLYWPQTLAVRLLAEPPPPELASRLAERGVSPISVGRVIVATWEPHQMAVEDVIRELGLDLAVVLNKRAIMILPRGVDKASGLREALGELGVLPHQIVGVGDAENDVAFLSLCGFSAAVANAVTSVKERVNWVAAGDHGEGVRELIERIELGDRIGVGPAVAEPFVPEQIP
jgi:hydroxymethylpyrimidine pyrophosphatase-like HAD family hydrolase